jgi:hypothetical protein
MILYFPKTNEILDIVFTGDDDNITAYLTGESGTIKTAEHAVTLMVKIFHDQFGDIATGEAVVLDKENLDVEEF